MKSLCWLFLFIISASTLWADPYNEHRVQELYRRYSRYDPKDLNKMTAEKALRYHERKQQEETVLATNRAQQIRSYTNVARAKQENRVQTQKKYQTAIIQTLQDAARNASKTYYRKNLHKPSNIPDHLKDTP
ncbi:MAG: hypothetical protein HQM11_02900 [SAR324 cluster bacterium]|nr:hypothetical protein [SAR324 cluster bacterium]